VPPPINAINEYLIHIKTFGDREALFDKEDGFWKSISFDDFYDRVRALALYLNAHEVKKGDKVGILVPPSIKWTIADFAILSIGAISVPLFANISEENFVFECTEAEVKTLFVGGVDQWKLLNKHRNDFNLVISLDEKGEGYSFNKVLDEGLSLNADNPQLFETLLNIIKPDDIASIVYSSGSTGVPKGIVLSQKSLFALLAPDPMKWQETDRYLSILPLAHIFGRLINFILIGQGVKIYYFTDMANLAQAFKEIKPTITAVVPRLLEKVYAKFQSNIKNATGFKKWLGQWAFNLAKHNSDSPFKAVADKLVYKKFREALGGQVRVIISGGAPLNPNLCRFFINIGIPVAEGYGLTEASIVSVNPVDKIKPGTVGVGQLAEFKISKQGEILIKTPVMMMEYFKNPELTKKTIDEEGWLHTGDKGAVDEEGYLRFLGRIKEFMKSSTGEYIAPVPIEQMLERIPFVDLAMIVADSKKFASVLLFPNFDVLRSLKASQNLAHLSDSAFLESDYIRLEMNNALQTVNSHLNHWEQIRDYRFTDKTPTTQTGELTPSMKIKREVVLAKYKDLIDSMYPDEVVI
jgi:long-chain acyl-CoA synthetase